jgi:hypothetical protein
MSFSSFFLDVGLSTSEEFFFFLICQKCELLSGGIQVDIEKMFCWNKNGIWTGTFRAQLFYKEKKGQF